MSNVNITGSGSSPGSVPAGVDVGSVVRSLFQRSAGGYLLGRQAAAAQPAAGPPVSAGWLVVGALGLVGAGLVAWWIWKRTAEEKTLKTPRVSVRMRGGSSLSGTKVANPKKRKSGKRCAACERFFARHSCGAATHGECDCPRCQGYCRCASASTQRRRKGAAS